VKILPFEIPKTTQESFHLQEDRDSHFYDFLHRHPQVQLSLILESEGKVIVGDFIGSFKPGDIFLIGPNLPHVFRNSPLYYSSSNLKAQMITLFFEWQTFGDKFLSLPELYPWHEFMKLSNRGLYIREPLRRHVARLMKLLFRTQEMDRLVVLLKILNLLAHQSEDFEPLASSGIYSKFDEVDGKKLADVYRFTMNEYHRKIRLDEVACIANMATSSFCRYFKRRTRKSYIDFLTAIRIDQAKKLLQEREFSISQICFEVGFNNLANFNRKFKALCGQTPTDFRRNHRNALY